jgi:hypothetical protein
MDVLHLTISSSDRGDILNEGYCLGRSVLSLSFSQWLFHLQSLEMWMLLLAFRSLGFFKSEMGSNEPISTADGGTIIG